MHMLEAGDSVLAVLARGQYTWGMEPRATP